MITLVFTGTRKGMTAHQKTQLRLVLRALGKGELHHGNAVGADREAEALAEEFYWTVVAHPAGDDPLARNREMVELAASRLGAFVVAAPDADAERQRSGTWATVRYARKAPVPVIMLARGK